MFLNLCIIAGVFLELNAKIAHNNLMRLHRFFIEQKISEVGENTVTDKDLIHQWQKVFRLKSGDEVILFDGFGFDYVLEIVSLDRNRGVLRIIEKKLNLNIPKREIHLFQSIIKKDKFEWVLEKGTELGVSYFHPIVSERSEKKNINFERARKIIKEACEQSGRANLPQIRETVNLKDALVSDFFSIAFHPSGDEFKKNDFEKEKILAVFIGPEGGWSHNELKFFEEKKVKILSLGKQILKSETAAVAVSSLLFL